MKWLLIVAWLVLLGAAALFAQQRFDFNLDEAPKLYFALPLAEQISIGIAVIVMGFIVVYSVWQSGHLARQNKAVKRLQTSVDGIRDATKQVDEAQHSFDAAGGHLNDSDPVEMIASLQKRVADSEQRTAFQKSRNESVDLRERLEELRQRQLVLRKQIGEVSDKRKVVEPVFSELRERQAQLEQSLAEVETDDNRNSLAGRVKHVSNGVSEIHARLKALEESWNSLNRFKDELDKSKTQLVRLQAPEDGLAAMIDQLHGRRDELTKTLAELETNGDQQLVTRVEALARSKVETERRVANLDECFTILDTIRRSFAELEERRAHLEHALAEVETDPGGRSLADRQNALNEFAAGTRVRVRVLQDSVTALNGFRQEIDKSQAALVPLQSTVDGIEPLIADLHTRRDRLARTIEEIETRGDEKLSARVEEIYRNKIETEQKITAIVGQFARLDTVRKEVNDLFAKLSGTLARLS
jgi:chromosome segregation ATPase